MTQRQQHTQQVAATLRDCLETFVTEPPQYYATSSRNFGAGAWESGQLIAHLGENGDGLALLARRATIFPLHGHEQDPALLRDIAVATIYLLHEDGQMDLHAESIFVYRLFSLAHFREYVENPATSFQYSAEQWRKWPPLLAYAGIAFGLVLEIVEDPFLLISYRRVGGTAKANLPSWAKILHTLLVSIKGVDEGFVMRIDWKETILTLLPIVEALTLHTEDWPAETGSIHGEEQG
jgi:hypothetical protein